MLSKEIIDLLLQVIKSWQVIAVTIAIVIYMFLVSYVARAYHRPRASKSRSKKQKPIKAKAVAGPEEVTAPADVSVNEELGLEEA